MTPEQFVYWLQGWCEMNGGKMPSQEQWNMINNHLKTVFNKVTPPLTPPFSPVPNTPWPNPYPWNKPGEIVCMVTNPNSPNVSYSYGPRES